MPRIEWDETFSVGHAEIDEQHKKWIDIHNTLHEMLLTGSSKTLVESTVVTLQSMKDYAHKHFAFEEEYMNSIGFPGKENHFLLHRAFDDLIERHIEEITSGAVLLNTDVMRLIRRWLENHILNEDMKYARFVAAK